MALRAPNEQSISGLSTFWQDAGETRKLDWDKWVQLFEVAIMAKFSISVEELTREETPENPRRQALMGGADPETAERKAVSIMYLALGDAARKTLLDRNPGLNAKTISLKQLIQEGENAFKVKRNRTMDRFLFLTRKQGEQETLEQFWNALNGLASICELQGLTRSLVHDVFIVNMRNTAVQERLCTEPREDPEDA